MTAPHVVIVVLTCNGWADTRACLESLARSSYGNREVLVVDSGSTDETVAELRRDFPSVAVIASGQNLGYAEGNNVGLRWALSRAADYVLLLNNDTILAEDCLDQLVESAEAEPRAGLVGPLVYHYDEPAVIQSAGGMQHKGWGFYHRARNEEDRGQFASPEPVDWLVGCAVLARRSFLENVGLLDPDYFLYGEDIDWSLRAREAGYKVLLAPQARIWHKGVQRRYSPRPHVTYYIFRNHLLLLKKHRAGQIALARAYLEELRTLVSWSVRPRWREKRAHRDALARALRDSAAGRFGPAGQ